MPEPALPPLPEGAVALLFTDIEGSTSMMQKLGEKYGEVLDEHDRILREVWSRHDGVEVDNEGDSFFVAFGDPQSAVAAAVDVQASLAQGNWPTTDIPRIRMGLHAGRPRVRGRRYWGIDVNYAARLCSAAHGGQALLSAAMRAAVPSAECESLGEHGLKDFGAARPLFHLVANGMHSHDFPPPRTVAGEGSNLPSIVTPIVGRDALIDEVVARVLGPADRAITLVGMGGVGKTRLVVACGQRLEELLPGTTMFVPLAAVSDVAAALVAIASAARAAGQDVERSLVARLRERRTVLILDNVEHLPALAEPVARLLEAVPDLKIVVTSQAPVGIRQETVVRVEPLMVPEDDADATVLAESSAAAMFLGLVAVQYSSFELTDSAAHAVAHLCALVDGMPLGLELAAARARVLGVDALERALERDLDALGTGPGDLPARHRGLRAALDWTVSLLSPVERAVFEGLGAFAAAWTLDEAESMFQADGPVDIWEVLTRLGDLSLVVARGDGRLSMAERVRRHAREGLAVSGREFERRRRHAELMADAMERRGPRVMVDLLRALANTQDAVEETMYAIGWAAEHDAEMHRRLIAFSALPLAQIGKMPPLVDDALALAEAAGDRDRIDGYLHVAACMVHGMGIHEPTRNRDEAQRALDVFSVVGVLEDRLLARFLLLQSHLSLGNVDDAAQVLADAIADAIADAPMIADSRWLPFAEAMRLEVEIARGDLAAAQSVLDRLPVATDYVSALADTYRADLAFLRRDFVAAATWYAAMIRGLPRHMFDNILFQIQGIGASLAGQGRDDDAVVIAEGLDHVYRERTGRPLGLLLPEYGPTIAAAYERVGDRLGTLQEQSRRFGFEALCDHAVDLAGPLR